MPRRATSYENTHFYKIVCKDVNIKDLYVGHTTDFKTRPCVHKHNCTHQSSTNHNLKVYQFIRQHNGWDNWDLILIETRSCEDDIDAKRVTRTHMEELHATLNSSVPLRTKQEWYQEQREHLLDQNKQYHQEHFEEIRKWRRKKLMCECGGRYTNAGKAQHFKTKRHKKHASESD